MPTSFHRFATWVVMMVVVSPDVTAFTLMPSAFNAMVYELTTALLALYAPTCNMAPGLDWILLDAMSIETFSMTALVALRTRGRSI